MATGEIQPNQRVRRRLDSDVVIWLTTVGRDQRPHAVPVWFWWDGGSFLIYSVPGQKVRDLQANPNVQLHLNTDRSGDLVARFDGVAEILTNQAPAYRVGKYLAKYRERIKGYGSDAEGFFGAVPRRHPRQADALLRVAFLV
jgi:PPOX class probable F420-dependent enzyme